MIVARVPGNLEVMALVDLLNGLLNAAATESVQTQLDTILACKTEEQLERAAGKQANIIEMVRDMSKLMCRSARPILRKKGHGDGGLRVFSQVLRELEVISALEQMSVLLGSYQYVLWMGPVADNKQARSPRRQSVRAMPASVTVAYIHHAALAPFERRKRACFRTVAFLDMMLREYAKSAGAAGEAWSAVEATRAPLNVWILGARDGEEGWLARQGYCEDAAGLLSGETVRMNLHLLGDVEEANIPPGRRVTVSVSAEPPKSKPDLVVCLHADERLTRWMPVLAEFLAITTRDKPVVAFTSRCEAEAESAAGLFGRLGSKVLLCSVRNLFSGMAAGPQAMYDDHGWVSAIQGSLFTTTQLQDHTKAIDLSSLEQPPPEASSPKEAEGTERGQRNPAVFWGILDLKYDPNLPLENRVKAGQSRTSP